MSILQINCSSASKVDIPTNLENHEARGAEKYRSLSAEQKSIVDLVLQTAENRLGGCYFIDGPGGSGKTFVYTAVYHLATSKGLKVINVAWTGIAANLLPDGRTVTSIFRLVVQDESRSSSMKRQSAAADNLRSCDIIIWDEAPMAPKISLETVSMLLQDIMQTDAPFGGKIMLLGGDFLQILPVVEKGSRGEIVDSCLERSPLWRHFQTLRLSGNMRLLGDDESFREWLLKVGNGELGPSIEIPQDMRVDGNLADAVFGEAFCDDSVVNLADTAILTPKNAEASRINDYVLEKLPGQKIIYRSEDEAVVEDPSDALNFPTEFLNKMTPASLPPHDLILKEGSIVMLLRNLDVERGLCNGTRLIVGRRYFVEL